MYITSRCSPSLPSVSLTLSYQLSFPSTTPRLLTDSSTASYFSSSVVVILLLPSTSVLVSHNVNVDLQEFRERIGKRWLDLARSISTFLLPSSPLSQRLSRASYERLRYFNQSPLFSPEYRASVEFRLISTLSLSESGNFQLLSYLSLSVFVPSLATPGFPLPISNLSIESDRTFDGISPERARESKFLALLSVLSSSHLIFRSTPSLQTALVAQSLVSSPSTYHASS